MTPETKVYAPRVAVAATDMKLDANESPIGPSRWVEWCEALDESMIREYPTQYDRFESAIANRIDVDPRRVLLTAGADDALERALRVAVQDSGVPTPDVVVMRPTFEMVERYTRQLGGRIVGPWCMSPEYPVETMLNRITESTAAVVVVSPNNPTGTSIDQDMLGMISERLKSVSGGMLLVDHAYIEYADTDLTDVCMMLQNCVVIRTFSKAWGMAGLRLGYAIGPQDDKHEWLMNMRAAGHPYAVSSLSLRIGMKWYEQGVEVVQSHIDTIRSQRTEMRDLFRGHGFEVHRSQGNFVLVRGRRVGWLNDGLRSLGIAVRTFPRNPGLEDAVRVTCPGTVHGMRRLEAAVRTVCAPDCLLFDLDGVLADVSRSYRRAIQHSAKHFGVDVDQDDIREAKLRGEANNDWVLTHRLIQSAGVDAAFADVKKIFQKLYLGSSEATGLMEEESLLASTELLEQLASALPLGIVTGRPKAEAEAFLVKHDIQGLFDTVVSMEDAPAKPNPAPVELALTRLGRGRAWMLGDTPDDVRAARGATVLPVGVLAPGEGEAGRRALMAAGASRVLQSVREIKELLR